MWPSDEREEAIRNEPQKWTGAPRIRLFVLFSQHGVTSAMLPIFIEQYEPPLADQVQGLGNAQMLRYTFRQETVPSYESMRFWAEQQIRNEPASSFRRAIERLLMTYCFAGSPTQLPKARQPSPPPSQNPWPLLCNILTHLSSCSSPS